MSSIRNHRFTSAASTLLVAVLGACTSDRTLTMPGAVPQAPPTAATTSRFRTEGYASRGELRQGYVLNRFGKATQVTYEVHDGLAIWEGDIVLGRASAVSMTALGARAITRDGAQFSRVPTGSQKTVIIDGAGFRWPGGVMPYEIDAALPNTQRLTDAIKLIEESTGGVTIVPRSGQADYVKFVTSTGCSSPIGRQGGEQQIKLGDDCSAGNAAHEMMHSLGMFHEQSRCDRDDFVEILSANVESGKEFNFDKECAGATDLGYNYDFGSMMHYPLDAFSSNGMPTIKLRPGVTYSGTIGQRAALSVLDVFTINWLYGSNNKPPVPIIGPLAAPYDEGSPVPLDATGSTDADDKKLTYRWNFGDGSCSAFPEPADCTQAMPNHTYANDGVYKVGLFVYDAYEEEATETFVTIKNVKPDIFLSVGVTPIDEGSALLNAGGGFLDPGADFWSATVNYGDGAGAQTLALFSKAFALTHTYADNGSYTISVTVKDDDETSTKSGTQIVRNVAPTVDAGADKTFTSGQTFDFAGSFSDPGVNDSPWNWSIAWGVGSPTTGSATAQGAITASRRVCGAGTYDVTLSVTDKDGGLGSDVATVTVGYVVVDLSIMPGSSPSPISLKKSGGLPVAILSSPTFDARTVDVASVRLGDEAGTDTPVAMQKSRYQSRFEDVNGDGRLDLVLTFDVPALIANGDLKSSTTSLVVRGFQGSTGDSCINFRGVGSVRIVS
ncbi:MAG: hypothetical protein JWL95_1030 [Gemmatimonadetes bacterium]|nr:hypothetical protein [Gemmatimonadota bacterium]